MISLFSLDVGAQSRRSRDQSTGSAGGSARASRSTSRGASSAAAIGEDGEVDSAGRKPCPKCGKRYNVSLWFERHYRDCKGPAKDNTGKPIIEFHADIGDISAWTSRANKFQIDLTINESLEHCIGI